MKVTKNINSLLNKCGYKVEKYDEKTGRTYYETQLFKALYEISALYQECIFNKEYEIDEVRLKLLSNLIGTGYCEGLYIIEYLKRSLHLDGDICEFGVAQGTTSALLAYEILNTNKNIWLFDSFEGLPIPSEKDILINDIFNLGSMEAYKGTMSCPEEMVRSRLSTINFPPNRIKIVPGFIEKTIHNTVLPQKVCFAYIDFDFYEPIQIALHYLDGVVQLGGSIIVDDYDFFSKGAKFAVDEFYDDKKDQYDIQFPVKSAGNFCLLIKKK